MRKKKPRFGSYFLEEIQLQREDVPSFKKYPFSLPVVRDLHSLTLDPKLTIFVGENGAGKSTLLEAIAVAWDSTRRAAPAISISRLDLRTRLLPIISG